METNVFFIFVFVFLINVDNIISYRSFKIIQESVKINVTALDIFSDVNVYLRKLNRTFEGLNLTVTVIRPLEDNLIFTAKSFEFIGNTYQPSVLDTQVDYCEFLRNPLRTNIILAMFYPTVLKYGNFPKKCPIQPGVYYIKNFNVNEEEFPPYFPGNRWRYLLSTSYRGRLLFEGTWNFRVEQKRKLQKTFK